MANWWEEAPLAEAPKFDAAWWRDVPKEGERRPAASFTESAADVARGMVNNLNAGLQRTSPFVTGDRPLGPLVQSDIGPAYAGGPNEYERFDPAQHVVLNDPQTGRAMVYARSPKMDEGLASSAGRVLSLGALTSPITRASAVGQPPAATQRLARDFERTGVDPNLPALTQSRTAGTTAQVLRNMPAVGDLTIGRSIERMRRQTGERAAATAAEYGDALDPAQAGRIVQQAAQDWRRPFDRAVSVADARGRPSRDIGFQTKAEALFGEVDRLVPQDVFIPTPGTRAALEGISGKFASNPDLGATMQSALFARQLEALNNGKLLTYPELKMFRQYVGERIGQPSLGTDIAQADWKRLYAGLSDDLEKFAQGASPEAGKAYQQANAFFRAGMQRAENALQPVADAGGWEGAYRQVVNAATTGGAADIMKGWQVKRSMPAEQWNQVASSWVNKAGRITNADGTEGFSPALFLREYTKLSAAGKDLLFSGAGKSAQREMLDSLANVARAYQGVEKLANPSGTARHLMGPAMTAGLLTDPASTIAAGLASSGTGILMSSPSFARWFVAAKMKGRSGMARHAAELSALARQEPALADAYQSLQRALSDDGDRRE